MKALICGGGLRSALITWRLEGRCSIQLSYGRTRKDVSVEQVFRRKGGAVDLQEQNRENVRMDFDLVHGVGILERTPSVLASMLRGLGSAWTDATEGPESWSPYDVVGHLIHGERTDWVPRAQIILAQGADRRFAPYDRLAQFRDSRGRPLTALLDEFAQLRKENLATLTGWQLTPRDLGLTGEHPAFGTVTLQQLLATWVTHDLGHMAQAARVMAKQYRDAIGPWRAYLPIVDR